MLTDGQQNNKKKVKVNSKHCVTRWDSSVHYVIFWSFIFQDFIKINYCTSAIIISFPFLAIHPSSKVLCFSGPRFACLSLRFHWLWKFWQKVIKACRISLNVKVTMQNCNGFSCSLVSLFLRSKTPDLSSPRSWFGWHFIAAQR